MFHSGSTSLRPARTRRHSENIFPLFFSLLGAHSFRWKWILRDNHAKCAILNMGQCMKARAGATRWVVRRGEEEAFVALNAFSSTESENCLTRASRVFPEGFKHCKGFCCLLGVRQTRAGSDAVSVLGWWNFDEGGGVLGALKLWVLTSESFCEKENVLGSWQVWRDELGLVGRFRCFHGFMGCTMVTFETLFRSFSAFERGCSESLRVSTRGYACRLESSRYVWHFMWFDQFLWSKKVNPAALSLES